MRKLNLITICAQYRMEKKNFEVTTFGQKPTQTRMWTHDRPLHESQTTWENRHTDNLDTEQTGDLIASFKYEQ